MTFELIYSFDNDVLVPITKMCGGKKKSKQLLKKRTKKLTKKRKKTYKKKKRKTS